MRGRAISSLVGVLGTIVFLSVAASAQQRGAPDGAVIVRPVQVREVRVNQPAPLPLHDQRPSFGLPRPVDPAFISRPIPRPQATVLPNSRFSNGARGRSRLSDFKPRHNVGFGVLVGYPVIYPYAYPYDPFSPLKLEMTVASTTASTGVVVSTVQCNVVDSNGVSLQRIERPIRFSWRTSDARLTGIYEGENAVLAAVSVK